MPKTSSLIETNFNSFVKDIADTNGFRNYTIRYTNNNSSTDGYIGVIHEVEIVSDHKTLALVLKSCDSNNKIRNVLPMEQIFQREIFMYERIFPIFRKLELLHGIIPSQFSAKLYKSLMCTQYDALAMENLKTTGYIVHDRKSLLHENQVILAIERYAKFHTISFAFKKQNPSKFHAITEPMDDLSVKSLQKCNLLKGFVEQMKKIAISLDTKLDRDAMNTYEAFIDKTEEFFCKLPEMVDEYSVIIHGDCWKNNMMFKYGDKNDPSKPTDIRLIDFQLSRLASPMIDLANFIYTCSPKEVLDDVQNYLKIYYDSLSSHLKSLGCNPDEAYPFTTMMEHWKKFARLGLVLRIIAIKIMLSDETQRKSIPDVLEGQSDAHNLFDYDILDADRYHDICKHTIIHFVKYNLI